MMNRRDFSRSALTAAGAAAVSAPSLLQDDQRYYEMTLFQMRNGDQVTRMDAWAATTLVPLMRSHGFGPSAFFKLAIGDNTPQLMQVVEYASARDAVELPQRLKADVSYREALAELEQGLIPPYDKAQSSLLRATRYSPPLAEAVGQARMPRIMEYRLYQSPTERQLQALHERFEGPEIPLFHKSGIFPILYGESVFGLDRPNLVYVTPFENLQTREQAWTTFRTDPEWQRVLAESIARDGEIVGYIHRTIWQAAPYSPIL
jgi:hypothetical protein